MIDEIAFVVKIVHFAIAIRCAVEEANVLMFVHDGDAGKSMI